MKKTILLVLLLTIGVLFFALGGDRYVSFEYIKSHLNELTLYTQQNPVLSATLYFFAYTAFTALALPGAAVALTLLGGALFGVVQAVILVSFASTLGATLAFLISRFLFKDYIERHFHSKWQTISTRFKKEGAFYLLMLRLIPIFPFFLINLVMGILPIKTFTFYWISQLGMLPATIIVANAGKQLGSIQSLAGLLSTKVILSLALLGVFPLLVKKIVSYLQIRKKYLPYKKPKKFDRNLVVIGGGAAGLTCAYIAALAKAKITLVEKHKMGGDCLNTGCVPSKTLIRSARFLHDIKRSPQFGFKSAHADFNFADIMQHIREIIRKIEPHDSMERYTQLGVECIQGHAQIVDPWTVRADDKAIVTRAIILATGGVPRIPRLPGLEQVQVYTSDTIWDLQQLPKDLLIVGGGPIGCELAQCFARFGTKVTLIELSLRILPQEDDDVSRFLSEQFRHEGITLLTDHKLIAFRTTGSGSYAICEHKQNQIELPTRNVLFAIGRAATTCETGIDKLGIEVTEHGTLAVNEYLQTSLPTIFACGDVAGPYQFTHTASHQAWYATMNALFGKLKRFAVDYTVIPWCTFTDPEVARVGLNENEAQTQNIKYEVTRYELNHLDRAITESENCGFVKVLTQPKNDKILGATVVGAQAGEIITEFISAMRNDIGLNKILGTIHIYPTYSEANKFVAGEWRKAHFSTMALKFAQKWHTFQRRG